MMHSGGTRLLLGSSSVQICGQTLSHIEVKDICDSLDNHTMQMLSLRECKISEHDFKKLAKAIGKCRSVLQVNFNLGVVDSLAKVEALQNALLRNRSLTSLFLHSTPLGSEGMMLLGNGLHLHPNIVSIDLGDCGLTDSGIDQLCMLIQSNGAKPGLQDLTLSGNQNVTIIGWTKLCMAISSCCTLRTLMLDYNEVHDAGAAALCVALASNKTLESLDLECCGISQFGALLFLHLFETYHLPMQQLILTENNIKQETLDAINKAIERNSEIWSMEGSDEQTITSETSSTTVQTGSTSSVADNVHVVHGKSEVYISDPNIESSGYDESSQKFESSSNKSSSSTSTIRNHSKHMGMSRLKITSEARTSLQLSQSTAYPSESNDSVYQSSNIPETRFKDGGESKNSSEYSEETCSTLKESDNSGTEASTRQSGTGSVRSRDSGNKERRKITPERQIDVKASFTRHEKGGDDSSSVESSVQQGQKEHNRSRIINQNVAQVNTQNTSVSSLSPRRKMMADITNISNGNDKTSSMFKKSDSVDDDNDDGEDYDDDDSDEDDEDDEEEEDKDTIHSSGVVGTHKETTVKGGYMYIADKKKDTMYQRNVAKNENYDNKEHQGYNMLSSASKTHNTASKGYMYVDKNQEGIVHQKKYDENNEDDGEYEDDEGSEEEEEDGDSEEGEDEDVDDDNDVELGHTESSETKHITKSNFSESNRALMQNVSEGERTVIPRVGGNEEQEEKGDEDSEEEDIDEDDDDDDNDVELGGTKTRLVTKSNLSGSNKTIAEGDNTVIPRSSERTGVEWRYGNSYSGNENNTCFKYKLHQKSNKGNANRKNVTVLDSDEADDGSVFMSKFQKGRIDNRDSDSLSSIKFVPTKEKKFTRKYF